MLLAQEVEYEGNLGARNYLRWPVALPDNDIRLLQTVRAQPCVNPFVRKAHEGPKTRSGHHEDRRWHDEFHAKITVNHEP